MRNIILNICLLATSVVFSEEASPAKKMFKALGAPAQPKVAAQWNRFHDVAEAGELLQHGKIVWRQGNVGDDHHRFRGGP
jgi:hypothetical protein